MTSKSKPKAATRSQKRGKRGSTPVSARPSSKPAVQPNTKHNQIVALLRRSAGATIAALMVATGWQQHSVRGFLAGVVRKKLGLNLVSEQTEKGRVYRITDRKASAATPNQD
jgi:hypothetical protein